MLDNAEKLTETAWAGKDNAVNVMQATRAQTLPNVAQAARACLCASADRLRPSLHFFVIRLAAMRAPCRLMRWWHRENLVAEGHRKCADRR